jgi:S1-C subfamily serine protease
LSDESGNAVNRYAGSAFAVSSDGLFITASHVLEDIEDSLDTKNRRIGLARDTFPFEVNKEVIVGANVIKKFDVEESDITVLSADVDELPSYEFLKVRTGGDSESMAQPVAAFGYPINEFEEDESWNISQRTVGGIVSNITTREGYPTYEIDTLFHPGLSGGPVISLRRGDVIGVVHARGSYLDEFNSKPFPTPSHLSEAKSTIGDRSVKDSVGSELERYGVCSRHEP